jgi:hypothetical protein
MQNTNISLVALYNALVLSADLRKQATDYGYAAKFASNDTEEAVTARQRFAASAAAGEEDYADFLIGKVGTAGLLDYAQRVVLSVEARWDNRCASFVAECDSRRDGGTDEMWAARAEALKAFDAEHAKATANLEVIKTFLANR